MRSDVLCSFAETGTARCLARPDTFRSCTLLRVAPIVLRRVQHPPACCDIPNPTRNQTNGYGSTAFHPQAHREMLCGEWGGRPQNYILKMQVKAQKRAELARFQPAG